MSETDETIAPAQPAAQPTVVGATPTEPPTEPQQQLRATSATPNTGAQRGIARSIHYTLSYLAQNAESGPRGAIVLLHDLPGGAFVWESALPTLAATGRAVYAFDMLGYGQSERPWPSDTSIWGHADCLQYALREMGLTEITLVGFGLGGGVAQTLATRLYREGVAKLALVNSYAYNYAFAPNWPLPDMAKHQDPDLAHSIKADQLLDELRQALPLGSANGLSQARLDAYANEWSGEVGKFMLMQHVRSMIPAYQNAVASDVTKLRIPVLALWGERDEVTPLALGQRLARETGPAQLEVIPGAGHMILDDAPGEVARRLAAFVRA